MSFFLRKHTGRHLDSLDGLRALSIVFVIVFHAYFFSQYAFESNALFFKFSSELPFWLAWVRRGDLGVDVFFVLSAFLIGHQLFSERLQKNDISLKKFYLKRFLRIYPAYLCALLIFGLAKGWDTNMLGNIFAYNNLFNIKDIVIPWSWSLSVEIQFYAVFPLLIITIRSTKVGLLTCLALLLLSTSWMTYFYFGNEKLLAGTMMDFILNDEKETALHYMQYLYVSPIARLPAFIFGVVAAWLWSHKHELLHSRFQQSKHYYMLANILLVTGCILIASFDIYQPKALLSSTEQTLYSINMLIGRPLFALFIASILLLSLLPKDESSFGKNLLSNRFLFPIARGSYAMYLFHPPFLFLSFYVLFGEQKLTTLASWELLTMAALALGFSWIFSIGIYYAVEKWCNYGRLFKNKEIT
ncbi:MAG: peptidoglycan/LPS O-acetylase OafA/YrhL [Flavobacteriales bacterium]|jgi:peptidoglycan/LPS O-acetylase OafA/YrhL